MMAGLSDKGLPLAVQFVGRYGADAMVLRTARAYERASEWHTRRPPID
jgi:Asp-tRNA(Asn)/Glu-tRNA(Gln) amidotransferase A subunit family amidase